MFVDRKNRKAAQDALEKAGDDMKKKGASSSDFHLRRADSKVSLWVFPEGTRSSSAEPELLPFKKGAFHLAVQAQVPIVPVVCENYHRLFDSKTRMEEGNLKIRGGRYIGQDVLLLTDSLAANTDPGTHG